MWELDCQNSIMREMRETSETCLGPVQSHHYNSVLSARNITILFFLHESINCFHAQVVQGNYCYSPIATAIQPQYDKHHSSNANNDTTSGPNQISSPKKAYCRRPRGPSISVLLSCFVRCRISNCIKCRMQNFRIAHTRKHRSWALSQTAN